jgi:ketosteroid isomerase-like protein
MTSPANVEVVTRAYEAWAQGDHEAFIARLDPEIELVLPPDGLNEGIHSGHDAVLQFLESYAESFENPRVEPERFFDNGDQVVVFARLSGEGRGSGVQVDVRPAHVLTLRGGKVTRLEVFPERDRKAVLEAAGLQG